MNTRILQQTANHSKCHEKYVTLFAGSLHNVRHFTSLRKVKDGKQMYKRIIYAIIVAQP